MNESEWGINPPGFEVTYIGKLMLGDQDTKQGWEPKGPRHLLETHDSKGNTKTCGEAKKQRTGDATRATLNKARKPKHIVHQTAGPGEREEPGADAHA